MDVQIAFTKEHLLFLMEGLSVTLEVAVIAIMASFIIGLALGIIRFSNVPILSVFLKEYSHFKLAKWVVNFS